MLADFQNKMITPSAAPEMPHAAISVEDTPGEECLPVKAALLTNCIAPYFLPVLRVLTNSIKTFHVFVSTPMEKDRPWEPDWNGVNVTLQKSYTTRNSHTFKEGFTERFE